MHNLGMEVRLSATVLLVLMLTSHKLGSVWKRELQLRKHPLPDWPVGKTVHL